MEASALRAPVMPARRPQAGPLLRLCSDDQLVALFRMGHDDAFRAIHDRYRPRLLAYTRRMLGGSRPDAEDALQDVFERAYRALRRDVRPVTLRAWLYRVARNRCLDELRRPAPNPGDVFDLSRRPALDPPAEAERREDLRRLVCDLGRLPEQQRSALLMREIDGLSHAELAEAFGMGVPAVKSLLARARMGLVEWSEARDAACADIRDELARAVDRGVRMSGRSRRHVRDCDGCRGYQLALRGVQGRLGALSPGHGVLAALAELLGVGGAGTGAAVSAGPSSAGGGALAAGTVAVGAPIAVKITAIVCAGAVAAGAAGAGAPDRSPAASSVTRAAHRPAPPRAPDARSATVREAAAATRRGTPPTAPVVAPAPPRDEPASVARAPRIAFALPRNQPLGSRRLVARAPADPHAAARRTGGMLAPDDLVPDDPATGTPEVADAPSDPIASYDDAPDAATAAPAPEGPAADAGAAPAAATPTPTDAAAAAAASAPPTEAPAPAPDVPADAPAAPAD